MASSRNSRIHPLVRALGVILAAVMGVAICTGNKGKDTPAPTPSVTVFPLQSGFQR